MLSFTSDLQRNVLFESLQNWFSKRNKKSSVQSNDKHDSQPWPEFTEEKYLLNNRDRALILFTQRFSSVLSFSQLFLNFTKAEFYITQRNFQVVVTWLLFIFTFLHCVGCSQREQGILELELSSLAFSPKSSVPLRVILVHPVIVCFTSPHFSLTTIHNLSCFQNKFFLMILRIDLLICPEFHSSVTKFHLVSPNFDLFHLLSPNFT
jgi:hypothetical protein